MGVTIRQIAEAAGVSRGTVDSAYTPSHARTGLKA